VSARQRTLLTPACPMAICLLAFALPVRAQDAPGPATAPSDLAALHQHAGGGERYSLARVFYEPGQRHELDLAEARALAGADAAGKSASPAVVRFNGWLSGPGPTHTWINGTAHVGGQRSGSMATGTPGEEPSEQPDQSNQQRALRRDDPAISVLTPAGETARFDPRSEQLVITNERGKEVHLRAGQSEDQDALLPLAAPGEPRRRPASDGTERLPATGGPSIGERP